MNSFEERLLDFLSSQENASEEDVRQHFRDDPDLDEQLLREYLMVLTLSNNLRTYRQADLQDAWNKIVHVTDLAEEEAAEKIIAEIEPDRTRVVTKSNAPARELSLQDHPANKNTTPPIQTTTGGTTNDPEPKVEPVSEEHGESSEMTRSNWWSIAATLLLAVGATLYFALRTPYQDSVALTDATVLYLPDNTKVTLEKGASVKFLRPARFEKSRVREVFVKGEAIFDVVSDPSRPFLVKSDLTQVQVLGTVFKFSANGDFSAAENIEGKVDYQVLDGSNSAVLNPGDKASYDGEAFLVEPFKLPEPPPPPPAPPTNKVIAADLIDILSEKYPISLEMAPYMPYNSEVLKVNLNDEMAGLFSDLVENQDVEIEYSFKNGNYRLNKLIGKDIGLRKDYDYYDFVDGKPFKKALH